MILLRMALSILLLALAQSIALAQQAEGGIMVECIACHGEDGIAKDKDVPHLAGQNVDYLIKQMHDFQKGRRQHREMRVMSRTLTDAEIIAIARYYAELPR